MTENKSDGEIIPLGKVASKVVEEAFEKAILNRLCLLAAQRQPMIVTLSMAEYQAMQDRIKELTDALVAIHRLNRDVSGWKPRAMESRRIAGEALRGHE